MGRVGLSTVVLLCLIYCSEASNFVMPWLCLERCNDTAADIEESLAQLRELGSECASAAAFELYNLGADGALVVNNLTAVGPKINAMGIDTFPMISSYPYPPQFLDWMRQLWNDQAIGNGFIEKLREEARKNGWKGYQIDWEPTATATSADAKQYAEYLSKMADALAPLKILPTVATWNSIWNLKELGQTSVYKIVTMSTYAKTLDEFKQYLNLTLQFVPKDKLGVGVEDRLDEGFAERIEIMLREDLNMLGVWKAPIPKEWIGPIKKFCLR